MEVEKAAHDNLRDFKVPVSNVDYNLFKIPDVSRMLSSSLTSLKSSSALQ